MALSCYDDGGDRLHVERCKLSDEECRAKRPVTRAYTCDGRCLDSRPSIHAIMERRVMEHALYGQAYFGHYATPAERATLNRLADESHEAAHALTEGAPWA